jgi:beta-propeller repeat-containing protein/Big-like domain-containing protein
MKRISLCLCVVSTLIGLGGGEAGAAVRPAALDFGKRPLVFEENRGQTDARVKLLARADGYGLFLTASEAVLVLRDGPPLSLRWEAARPAPRVSGERELPGRSHYLLGNDPARWRTGIPSYEKVRYQGLYPGIDLVFYGNPRQLEYDFEIAPGADPGKVRLAVEGADRMEIDPAGDLVLNLGGGEVRLKKPVSHQEIAGARREVASRWRRSGDGRLGFDLGAYDSARPLVIDPVLVYSTFLGGSDTDFGNAVAADRAGNAYITGWTLSADFPSTGDLRPHGRTGFTDAFVTKLDPRGALVYSVYLGGSGPDTAYAIAAGSAGEAYVTGRTASEDFPAVNPLPPRQQGGSWNVFVAKLAPNGSSLLYSTRLGGSDIDEGHGIAVDPAGYAYVTGHTFSNDFPSVNALSSSLGGFLRPDAFVAKLSPGGSSLVYSTYLGGTGWDQGKAIAVDAMGRAWVTGITESGDFPAAGAVTRSYKGGTDGFVAALGPSGSPLILSTFLGGGFYDAPEGVAVDRAGNAYVAGRTYSPDFPTVAALQPQFHGSAPYNLPFDAFVSKLAPTGALVYSTFLGGAWSDEATGIAVDWTGSAYVTGTTLSPDFPLKNPLPIQCRPLQSPPGSCSSAFLARLSPAGSELLFSTFLDFANFRGLFGLPVVAVDPLGYAYAVGTVSAENTGLPLLSSWQPSLAGDVDAFILKLSFNSPPDCSAAAAIPAVLWPPNGQLVPISIRNVTDPDGDPVTLTITAVRQDEPLSGRGPDVSGIGTPNVSLRADRAGGGDGRVYRLSFTATDPQGASCAGTVTVCVPHDQGRGATCGDGGGLFNSGG